MSRIGSDEELRTAVHEAVGDVRAGFDLLERVRGGVVRRRRRSHATGVTAAAVALTAAAGLAWEWPAALVGGRQLLTNTAGRGVPDCSESLAPSFEMARNDPRADGRHIVPGRPVAAAVCPLITDTRPLPSNPAIQTLGHQQVLRGDRLKQVLAALDNATMGSLYDNAGPPANEVLPSSITLVFRYSSGEDVTVNVPLYDNRVAIVESPTGLMAHFYPKPIPDVLAALGGGQAGS